MAATSLPTLGNLSKLTSYNITRILGLNPGKFTLQGTNTYLLGHDPQELILIDTGEGQSAYLPLLESAISSYSTPTAPARIANIILTHYHHDHIGGLSSVLQSIAALSLASSAPPKIWKYCSSRASDNAALESILSDPSLKGKFSPPASGSQSYHDLAADQLFHLGSIDSGAVDGARLRVLHTPGHTRDSICLLLTAPLPASISDSSAKTTSPPVLFCADTVLGHGTAVFEDLGTYLASLQHCIAQLELSTSEEEEAELLCGHGETVKNGKEKLKEYVRHRMEREAQVMRGVVGDSDDAEPKTAEELVASIYGATIPDSLILAATRGVMLHLEKLLGENKVVRIKTGGEEEAAEDDMMAGWGDRWKASAAAKI